jgi:predicted dienelactone hydrolase
MNMRIGLLFLVVSLAACGSDESPANFSADLGQDFGADLSVLSDAGIDAQADSADADLEVLPPQPWSVMEPGYYRVGYRSGFEVTYDAIGEPGRTFEFVVWYPTLDKDGPEAKYYNVFRRPEVQRDASLAITEPAPVLIFSHGNSSFAEQSYYMTEFFASHGFVVVALNHTGNTFKDTQGGIDLTSGAFRPQDITALLDRLETWPADDVLKPVISDKIVLSGHSFGGYTTLASTGSGFDVDYAEAYCATNPNEAFCEILAAEGVGDLFRTGFNDDRIKAAIPQTPGGFLVFQDRVSQVKVPTMLMTSLLDQTLPAVEEGDPIWNAMEGPHMRVDLLRGGHFTYSNMCELFGAAVLDDGCSDQFLPFLTASQIIDAYSLAFARKHLLGDTTNDALLDGTDQPWPTEVGLDWKTQ